MNNSRLYILLILTLFFSQVAFATHLKGGEISIRRISTTELKFEFTVTTYTENNTANQHQDKINLCFGDGSPYIEIARIAGYPIVVPNSNGTMKNIYKYNYTYPSPSLSYTATVVINNRNENVLNIPNSVQTSFFVQTTFAINAGLGLNSTPILMNHAVDFTAVVGQKFIHNPNAVDPDGDSLAYRMVACKAGNQDACTGRGAAIPGFNQPNVGTKGTLDISSTGDLIWDSPTLVGKYNTAFIVEEWRNGIKISETTRDMQIEVIDADNKAPILNALDPICVEAGTLITKTISAKDTPASAGRLDPITITSTGAVYANNPNLITSPFAIFASGANQPGTGATGSFTWQTSCNHIREQTYDVLFKVKDSPPAATGGVALALVDNKIFKIKVVAPSVKNLKSSILASTKSVRLIWNKYICQQAGVKIIIYRKAGDCPTYSPAACTSGMPNTLGYTEIARVAVADTTYIDNNGGKGLTNGSTFSYRVVAIFPAPSKGQSPVSEGTCVTMKSPTAYITNVSITKSDSLSGEIFVKWTRPQSLNTALFPGPYSYKVFRAIGENSLTFSQIGSTINTDLSGKTSDTTYTDKSLNTKNIVYRYLVQSYFTNNGLLSLMDSTAAANSVRASATTASKAITLSWAANVPWNNQNQTHKVYRETKIGSGIFNQIAEVPVTNSFTYTDSGKDTYSADGTFNVGMSPDTTYCYVVETLGKYSLKDSDFGTFINRSQKVCAKPTTNLIPCAPSLNIDLLDCNSYKDCSDPQTFQNTLTWTLNTADNCANEIAKFTLYFAKNQTQSLTKLVDLPVTTPYKYIHNKTESFIGCYAITLTDKYGTESPKSNIVCKDNCPAISFPNVISPNGDGKNDVFQAMECPLFVDNINCEVYDRNGSKVYFYNGSLKGFAWDGKNTHGSEMAAGAYYYNIDVIFNTLNAKKANFKGWIEILR